MLNQGVAIGALLKSRILHHLGVLSFYITVLLRGFCMQVGGLNGYICFLIGLVVPEGVGVFLYVPSLVMYNLPCFTSLSHSPPRWSSKPRTFISLSEQTII